MESSDAAIISKTLDGIITSWNPAAERLFGYAPAEVVGRDVSLIIPSDRSDELNSILERFRQGHVIGAASICRDSTEKQRVERERHSVVTGGSRTRVTNRMRGAFSSSTVDESRLSL